MKPRSGQKSKAIWKAALKILQNLVLDSKESQHSPNLKAKQSFSYDL